MRILNVYSARGENRELHLASMRDACSGIWGVEFFNQCDYFDTEVLGPYGLDVLYRSKDKRLMEMYDRIYSMATSSDVLIVDHENYLHPDFLLELRKITYTVFYTADDPESSYLKSMPYVRYFDHVFCCSVLHSESVKMVDKLYEWGARRAHYRPFGLHKGRQLVADNQVADVLNAKKNQIVYIGGPYSKSDFLIELKKYYKERFILMGHWGGIREHAFRAIKRSFFDIIKPASKEKLERLYIESLIGVNMHLSFGPSNLRSFELPAALCAQVSDNPSGYEEVFDLKKEIVCYKNGNLEECINAIDFLLSNPSHAKEIAYNSYKRTLSEYTFKKQFQISMEKISIGINEKSM